jgi:hypothetical protein
MTLPQHLLPWLLAALLLAVFFALGLGGWPGEFSGAGGSFCEGFRASWVKQPANTWSNLGFVAAGLWMASRLRDGVDVPAAGRNAFTRSSTLPLFYAALVVLFGPGSMAMHGSGRAWGATIDVVSMLLYIAFPVAYAAARCFRSSEQIFWPVYLALTLGLAVPRAFDALPVSGSAVYAALIPAVFILEAVAARRRPEILRRWPFMLFAGASFLVALVVWRLSHTGAPLCEPNSLLQGHAVWHLLCAASTVGIFLFYATEDDGAA